MFSGLNIVPSFEQTTSKPCFAPMSVRYCSANASFVGLSDGRVIALCWKPADFVKKRIRFFGPSAACDNVLAHGASRLPPARRLANFRTSRRLGLCMGFSKGGMGKRTRLPMLHRSFTKRHGQASTLAHATRKSWVLLACR